jgi:hypothetical protein
MKQSTRTGLAGAVIALGMLVAITPRFLFSICEYNGIFMQLGAGKTAHMPCYYTARGAYIIGTLVALIGITLLLAKARETVRLLSVVLGGAGIAVMLLPILYPICPNPDEPCNHGTKPMLIVLGIIILMIAVFSGLSSRKSQAEMSTPSDTKPEIH